MFIYYFMYPYRMLYIMLLFFFFFYGNAVSPDNIAKRKKNYLVCGDKERMP